MTNGKIRLLLADDHNLVRSGMRSSLERYEEMDVVGEAANGREAIEMAKQLEPDVVVMDHLMPSLSGLEATRRLRKECPDVNVVVVSMETGEDSVFKIFEAGAKSFIPKDSREDELRKAINEADRGAIYVPENVPLGLQNRPTSPLDKLTSREREILQLLSEGKSGPDVAGELNISIKTVETHRNNLMRKLDIHNVAELVRFAIRNKVVPA